MFVTDDKCDQRKQDLTNHDMLHLNYEIYINDNIIRYLLLWMSIQSSIICIIDSLSSLTNETYLIRDQFPLKIGKQSYSVSFNNYSYK